MACQHGHEHVTPEIFRSVLFEKTKINIRSAFVSNENDLKYLSAAAGEVSAGCRDLFSEGAGFTDVGYLAVCTGSRFCVELKISNH